MPRTTAPLLSFSASGQLGETLVFSSWKGRGYARRYVVPSNPQSTSQTQTRETFRGLNNLWRYLPGSARAAWELYADNSRFTARNGWLKQNVSTLRTETDLANLLISPAAGGGLVAASISTSATSGGLDVTLTAPSLPSGWSVTKAHACAVLDEDIHDLTIPSVGAATDDSDPYVVQITGLTSGSLYRVGGWFEYVTSAGQTAYGTALSDSETPSA